MNKRRVMTMLNKRRVKRRVSEDRVREEVFNAYFEHLVNPPLIEPPGYKNSSMLNELCSDYWVYALNAIIAVIVSFAIIWLASFFS